MSKTSLNTKCEIDMTALVSFKMFLSMIWDILGTFSSKSGPNEINIQKLEQLNHLMIICIYKGDLTGCETKS